MEHGAYKDDASLVAACVARDLVAWSAFVSKFSRLISHSAVSRLRKYGFELSVEDIADIRQNVLAAVWRDNSLSSVTSAESLPYWIAIVAGNFAMDYLKAKRAREPKRRISLSDMVDDRELGELLPSPAPGPADESARGELAKRVDEAIARLPAKEGLAVRLRLLHEQNHEEIGKLMGLPTYTVGTYVERGKEKLKRMLKDFR